MTFGYNTIARKNSFSSGDQSQAMDHSIALGRKSQANARGAYPQGNSIALGDSCISNAIRSVTIGRRNFADTTLTSTGSSTLLIGYKNRTTGVVSTCLGSNCFAGGVWSTAIGYYANITHIACFVFSDASSAVPTNSTANYQFLARASGGVIFYSDSLNTMGVTLASGSGSWASVSDVNKKENFLPVDYEEMLGGINRLKIRTWNYKSQSSSIRHIGPMAQDFYRIFHVGENNFSISSIDADGVVLSGIKGINNRLNNLKIIDKTDALETRIKDIDDFSEFNSRLDAIEAAIDKK
jgi:endosialidase-like protein